MWELKDKEGWEQWQADNPKPTDEQMEAALHKFFTPRPDMSAQDFLDGVDPAYEG